MRNNHYIVLLLSLFNLLFPISGVFINLIYYFLFTHSNTVKKIIYINLSFSMAFIAFLYVRTDLSGDVYRYGLSLNNYSEALVNGERAIIESVYEIFYPVWYFIFYAISEFNLDIRHLTSLAAFTIYSSALFVIYSLNRDNGIRNADKQLVFKLFAIFSFISIFSSYKTLWSFSLVLVGVILLLQNKKRGSIFCILGAGIHPVALFPVLVYLLSTFIKCKKIYLPIFLLLGFILHDVVYILNDLLSIPFIGSKIDTYINGKWSQYRFHDNGEYIKAFILLIFICFNLIVFLFRYHGNDNCKSDYFKRYNNFILWYFCISLLFIRFRTIETRLLLDGFVFFIPLFYQVFISRKIYQKTLLSFVMGVMWIIMFDLRTVNFLNQSFKIGAGFPMNLLDSPFVIIFRGAT